jgi:hypothetical protein
MGYFRSIKGDVFRWSQSMTAALLESVPVAITLPA